MKRFEKLRQQIYRSRKCLALKGPFLKIHKQYLLFLLQVILCTNLKCKIDMTTKITKENISGRSMLGSQLGNVSQYHLFFVEKKEKRRGHDYPSTNFKHIPKDSNIYQH